MRFIALNISLSVTRPTDVTYHKQAYQDSFLVETPSVILPEPPGNGFLENLV